MSRQFGPLPGCEWRIPPLALSPQLPHELPHLSGAQTIVLGLVEDGVGLGRRKCCDLAVVAE